jgi:hypothetical protein
VYGNLNALNNALSQTTELPGNQLLRNSTSAEPMDKELERGHHLCLDGEQVG